MNYTWYKDKEIMVGDHVTIQTLPGSWTIKGLSQNGKKATLVNRRDDKTEVVPTWKLDFRSRG